MKTLTFIAVLLFPVLSFSTLGDETCETAIAKSAIDAVKSEIAALLIEKSETGSGSPLKSLLNTNIANKIKELQMLLGRPVDKKELAALVHEREGAEQEKKEEKSEIEKRTRKIEKEGIAVKETKFEMEMGVVNPLNDMYLGYDSLTEGGVQWTRDDHFVFIQSREQKSWIYDLIDSRFVDYHPENGRLSAEGHFFAEKKSDGIYIRNLDNQDTWGPFPGTLTNQTFGANSIVVTETDPITHRDTYFWFNFRTNKKQSLGQSYYLTEAGDIAAVREGDFTRVIDLKSGVPLKSYPSHGEAHIWFPNGGLWYETDGQKYFVRLSDQKEFPLRDFEKHASGLSHDGTKLILRLDPDGNKSVSVHDFTTGNNENFKDFAESAMNEDRTKVLLYGSGTKRSIVVDLQTMQQTEIPLETNHFSPNGRWVYYQGHSKNHLYHYDLYDLVNGKQISFDAGFNFDFLGRSNYFTSSQTSIQGTPAEIYVNDAVNWPGSLQGLRVGEGEAKPSSTGRYIVTRAGGKIKLLEVGLVPRE